MKGNTLVLWKYFTLSILVVLRKILKALLIELNALSFKNKPIYTDLKRKRCISAVKIKFLP